MFTLIDDSSIFFIKPTYADVEEVEMENQQINKTEPDDGSGGQTDGRGRELTWRDKIMKRCNLSYFREMIR
jgi:hypothetical protein